MLRHILLILHLFLAMPLAAQEAPTQPSGAISVEADAAADAAIEARIEAIISELAGYDGVGVEVREGIVTFTGEVLDGEAIPRLQELASRVEGVVAVENEVSENIEVGERLDPVVDRFGTRLSQAFAYLPLLAVAALAGLVVVVLGWSLAAWERPWGRLAPNAFIGQIYRSILRLAAVMAGVVVALDILNATAVLTGLLGAAGIVGLAVGFAVRDTVENFIASVMLSLRQPFRPNDIVEIEGNIGSVVKLTSRATILLDPDGNQIRLPNATVFKARIVNYTRNDERRFGFVLGIDPADDIAETRRIAQQVLGDLPFTLEKPAPQVWIRDVGASTVDIEFFGWIRQSETDFFVARTEAIRLVMAALTRAGIGMPEPTYRLNILGGGLPVVDLPDQANRPDGLVAHEGEAPAERAAPAPEEIPPDRTLEEMAEQRRDDPKGGGNLLNSAAPEE